VESLQKPGLDACGIRRKLSRELSITGNTYEA